MGAWLNGIDLCSACLAVLQCQQPCMTRSTGWVSRSVSRSSYVCWHTSVCTVWHPTTCRTSAHYWPLFLAVFCYVQLTQINCWYHGPAWPALDYVPSDFSGQTAQNDIPAHQRNLDLSLSDFRHCRKLLCSRLFRCSYSARLCDS